VRFKVFFEGVVCDSGQQEVDCSMLLALGPATANTQSPIVDSKSRRKQFDIGPANPSPFPSIPSPPLRSRPP